jgi:hypothetical protein
MILYLISMKTKINTYLLIMIESGMVFVKRRSLSTFKKLKKKKMPPKENTSKNNVASTNKGRRLSVLAGGTSRRKSEQVKDEAQSEYLNISPDLMKRTGLSVEQLQEIIEIFQLVDVDHGGTISSDELASLLRTLGLNPTKVN